MFWEKEYKIGLCIVYEAMSAKEFENLKIFIHFTNNNVLDMNDKLAKIRSLYDIMNKHLN